MTSNYTVDPNITDSAEALKQLSEKSGLLYGQFYLPQAQQASLIAQDLLNDTGRSAADATMMGTTDASLDLQPGGRGPLGSLTRAIRSVHVRRGLQPTRGLLSSAFLDRQLSRRQLFATPEARRQARRAQFLAAARGATAAGLRDAFANREAGLNILSTLGGLAPAAALTGLNALSQADVLRKERTQKYNDIMAAREQQASARLGQILDAGARLFTLFLTAGTGG